MAVDKKIMHFRNERARELERMAQLLDNCIGNDVNTTQIYTAINDLRNENFIPVLKGGGRDEKIWGYDIDGFEMALETLNHVSPSDINKGSVHLSMKLRASVAGWDDMSDPFLELGFKVFVKGIGSQIYHFGFHIDRHIAAGAAKEPHPVYHLQYDVNPTKSATHDSGVVMYLDTPRLMHCPLDFILGVGFLTSNFFPTAFESLLEEREYHSLYSQYQERIWKPYFHTLANHWKPFSEAGVSWKPVSELCPIFV